jgi:hypothetical protein
MPFPRRALTRRSRKTVPLWAEQRSIRSTFIGLFALRVLTGIILQEISTLEASDKLDDSYVPRFASISASTDIVADMVRFYWRADIQ